ncbi:MULTISPECIES: nuclear transport factor 2 family protein [Burkholderiaceae]|uniref:Succinyl-CoA synthetase, alpha subunit n=1 Tax=Caballeronia sordidicola TaxID=196367 RepID=A0A242M9M5_CABSO|nr:MULTISPECIES: nuclear transport factor 2 family protein [Burkholderiaceae]AME28387.1 polyketide cyclase [Burkholderia sp. PAMC 26561]OTP67867.1 Succinyl-CoA synthetase, alpha subunit [Caballeronia sordidicola]
MSPTDDTTASLLMRIAVLEAERAVRRTLTRYMALCDVPAGGIDGATLGSLFTDDAIWQGIGPLYAGKFGYLQGREAILAMLTRYLPPTPHFVVNTHFLTSETIDVDAHASAAKGRWIMLQASGYVDDHAELIAARLEVDFVPSPAGAAWLIRRFRTQRLFDAPWQVHPSPTDNP